MGKFLERANFPRISPMFFHTMPLESSSTQNEAPPGSRRCPSCKKWSRKQLSHMKIANHALLGSFLTPPTRKQGLWLLAACVSYMTSAWLPCRRREVEATMVSKRLRTSESLYEAFEIPKIKKKLESKILPLMFSPIIFIWAVYVILRVNSTISH